MTTLNTITKQITSRIGKAAVLFIEIGGLLEDAKQHFTTEDKFDGKAWLDWAMNECGIKKAQVYNLIKVNKAFGDVKEFHGCAMRVLLTLSKDDNQDMRDEALAAIEEGKLVDSKWIREYLDTEAKRAEEAKQAEDEINNEDQPSDNVDSETGEQGTEESVSDSDDATASCQDSQDDESSQDEPTQAEPTSEAVNSLQAEIDRLKAELAEANKPKRKPRLNQFDTGISYIILGVAPTANKREIKKAYRMLSSMYHPDKNSIEDKDFYNEITAIINAAHDDMTK